VDEVICLASPEPFWAVGVYYDDFRQTEDDEVERLLREARANAVEPTASVSST
jgi:putative phosphoribosyl transferase